MHRMLGSSALVLAGLIVIVLSPTAHGAPYRRPKLARSPLLEELPDAGLRFNLKSGTLRQLRLPTASTKFSRPRAVHGDHEQVARSYLRARAEILGLLDPDRELRLVSTRIDDIGHTHLRFAQQHLGIPLWRREVRVHFDARGELALLQGDYVRSPQATIDNVPRITGDDAAARAWAHAGAIPPPAPTATLIFFEDQQASIRLAWMVDVAPAIHRRWRYFVDAHTGTVLHHTSRIHEEIVAARGSDLSGTLRLFNAWHQSSSYYLLDPSTPTPDGAYNPLAGLDPTGDMAVYDADNTDGANGYYHVQSTSSQSGWDATAVSAAHHTLYAYDYYLTRHGRRSIDDAEMNLVTLVHFEDAYANAFWNGTMMVYGDGDGVTFGPLAKCLDIAAHELTHGITETSSGLIYEDQSGALNESFSDVFAALIESTVQASDDNWRIGEGCTLTSPGFLRSLADPTQGIEPQPKHMSDYQNLPSTLEGDYGGVHVNSGIPNRAAYLIAAGLSAEGLGTSIGINDTARLYYAAITDYLSAYAQFTDAREALIAAAEALWGASSVQATAVRAAWAEVGIDEGDAVLPTQVPTSADAAAGDDLMVYLFPTDGSYDPYDAGADTFDVYAQTMPQPFLGYDPMQDHGPLNIGITAAYTRPAVYTTTDGSFVLYVGADDNVYVVGVNGSGHRKLTSTGDFYSIAVTPDGRTLAFTTPYSNDPYIRTVNLATGALASFALTPTGYDTTSDLPTIEYADSLAFDYTGRRVVFDALNCVSVPQSSCATGGGYRYYSIGFLDLADGAVTLPFPNQSPAVAIGYPTFASNNDHVVAFDRIDDTGAEVLSFDLATHRLSHVLDPVDIFSIPSFSGDDSHVIGLVSDGSVTHAYRVPLDASWGGQQGAAEQLNDYDVALPIVHRAAVRTLVAVLAPSTSRIDFAEVPLGESSSARLTLSNTGNRDVRISDIRTTHSAFTHNGTNGLIPRGASMTVTVTFSPGSSGKRRSAALVIESDADPSTLSVTLVGNGPDSGDEGCSQSGSSLLASALVFLVWTRRRFRR